MSTIYDNKTTDLMFTVYNNKTTDLVFVLPELVSLRPVARVEDDVASGEVQAGLVASNLAGL